MENVVKFRFFMFWDSSLLLVIAHFSLCQAVVERTEHAIHRIGFKALPTMSDIFENVRSISVLTSKGDSGADRENTDRWNRSI